MKNKTLSIHKIIFVLVAVVCAAMIVNTISNTAKDSRDVIARQQQATLQAAVNNWISAQIGGSEFPDAVNPAISYDRTVAYVRNKYNYAENWWVPEPAATGAALRTARGRVELIADYLDNEFVGHFIESPPGAGENTSRIQSAAMKKNGQYLQISGWPEPTPGNLNPYPKIDLLP